MTYKTCILIVLTLGTFFSLIAQSERKMTRNGNTNYESGNFIDAEINYKKALEKNSDLLEAQFNLGDALVKQERFVEALESFEKDSSKLVTMCVLEWSMGSSYFSFGKRESEK